MIAELHNKISRTGSNLHDRLEDQLTGDFFGPLRYLPFQVGLHPVLRAAWWITGGGKDALHPLLQNVRDYDYKVAFWRRFPEGEIDVLLRAPKLTIGVEVKYGSSLSSDDLAVTDPAAAAPRGPEDSTHQLSRYARILAARPDRSSKHLVYLAPADGGDSGAEEAKSRIHPEVTLWFLSWERALQVLQEARTKCPRRWQRRILHDVIRLLERKGFDPFRRRYCQELWMRNSSGGVLLLDPIHECGSLDDVRQEGGAV